MSSPFVNSFISTYVPQLWNSQLPVFGRAVTYWPGGDSTQAMPVTLLWIEGAESEQVSPGRYSRAYVQNASLPAGSPAQGDALTKDDGSIFDVVKVTAYAYYFAEITLQER